MTETTGQTGWRWVRKASGPFAGVSGGLAEALGVGRLLVRVVFVITAFTGAGLVAYLFLAIAFPREDRLDQALDKMILGVCALIHKRGDMEVGLARLIALCLLLASFGAAIIGYIVLYFILTDQMRSKSGDA